MPLLHTTAFLVSSVQSELFFFFFLIHLTAASISVSFSCIFFSFTFLLTFHVFSLLQFSLLSLSSLWCSVPVHTHLDAMFSQFFFQLKKKYIPESVDQPATRLRDQFRLPLDSNVFPNTLAHILFPNTFGPCLWISHLATQWVSWKKWSDTFTNDSPHLVSRCYCPDL